MTSRRIRTITLLLLGLGLGSALAIYLLAPPDAPYDPLMSDPRADKKYRRELAVYGGTANVMASDFMEWFSDRWHGRNLAGTVAVLTVMGALAFRFVALAPPLPPLESGTTPEQSDGPP
jgi:hypothetical protein